MMTQPSLPFFWVALWGQNQRRCGASREEVAVETARREWTTRRERRGCLWRAASVPAARMYRSKTNNNDSDDNNNDHNNDHNNNNDSNDSNDGNDDNNSNDNDDNNDGKDDDDDNENDDSDDANENNNNSNNNGNKSSKKASFNTSHQALLLLYFLLLISHTQSCQAASREDPDKWETSSYELEFETLPDNIQMILRHLKMYTTKESSRKATSTAQESTIGTGQKMYFVQYTPKWAFWCGDFLFSNDEEFLATRRSSILPYGSRQITELILPDPKNYTAEDYSTLMEKGRFFKRKTNLFIILNVGGARVGACRKGQVSFYLKSKIEEAQQLLRRVTFEVTHDAEEESILVEDIKGERKKVKKVIHCPTFKLWSKETARELDGLSASTLNFRRRHGSNLVFSSHLKCNNWEYEHSWDIRATRLRTTGAQESQLPTYEDPELNGNYERLPFFVSSAVK